MSRAITVIAAVLFVCASLSACGEVENTGKSEPMIKRSVPAGATTADKSTTTATAQETTTTTTATSITTTTTTTTVTTTTTSTTTTQDTESQYDDVSLISSGELSNGTTMEVYQSNSTYDWIVKLIYTSDDKQANIIQFSETVNSIKDKSDEYGMPTSISVLGFYEEKNLFMYVMTKNKDSEYESIGIVWLDDDYEQVYNELMDKLSSYVN
jgi:hypothetical protein